MKLRRNGQNTTPSPDVSMHSKVAHSSVSVGHRNCQTSTKPTAAMSVVIVGQDGSRVTSEVSLPAANDDQGQSTRAPVIEDTLTKRTTGNVLSKELGGSKPHMAREACRGSDGAQGLEKKFPESIAEKEARQLKESEARRLWEVGSVVEVFSASLSTWYPALLMDQSAQDMLTVQFWLDIDDTKTKTLRRSDEQLAALGTHCGAQLPPGFEMRASKSRPGETVYVDMTNGLRYGNAELAWAEHFTRWLTCADLAPEGMQTISKVSGGVFSAEPLEASQEEGQHPTFNKLDVTRPDGLVTEYELSRELQPVEAEVPTFSMAAAATPANSSQMGLVTEYECDWNSQQRSEKKSEPEPVSLQSLASISTGEEIHLPHPA